MLYEYYLKTECENFYNITAKVKESVIKSQIKSGICIISCPHTTAGITINENADPDVVKDMLFGLSQAFPNLPEFRHGEGNSTAHLKSSCVGSNQTIIIENGSLVLGTWQGIYFCEFDGPRTRQYNIIIMGLNE